MNRKIKMNQTIKEDSMLDLVLDLLYSLIYVGSRIALIVLFIIWINLEPAERNLNHLFWAVLLLYLSDSSLNRRISSRCR